MTFMLPRNEVHPLSPFKHNECEESSLKCEQRPEGDIQEYQVMVRKEVHST